MFNLQFEKPYLSKAQEILGRFCTEVEGKGPKTINVLETILEAAHGASGGRMQFRSVNFGDEKITETPMHLNTNLIGIVNALREENNALMLSTSEGAVFCVAVVRVGDKQYVSLMNPQTALEIKKSMEAMVNHVKENDQTKTLEQLTLWDRICNWFAQHFRDRPGEAVGRAEAYRSFYEGMQKHIDMLGRVGQTQTAQSYKYNRSYQKADPGEPQNKEPERKNNEALQKRNAELNARAERIEGYKKLIKEYEDNIAKWEPHYQKVQEQVNEYQKQLFALDEFDMTHRGKSNKNRLVNEQNDLEKKIDKVTKTLDFWTKYKKHWDGKGAAEKKIETTREAIETARNKLKDAEADLKSAELNLQYWSGIGQRDGAWLTPEQFLEGKYKEDKAARDRKFEEDQKDREEKIALQQKVVDNCQKELDQYKKELPWFRSKEQKEQLGVYETYLKESTNKLKEMQREDQQAAQRHTEEDQAKQKELLSPSAELLAKTADQLHELRAKCDAAKLQYDSFASILDQAKQKVADKEEAHKKAVEAYDKDYGDKEFKFDEVGYRKLQRKKNGLETELQDKKLEIERFEANVATYQEKHDEILGKLVPIQKPNADLELSLIAWKSKLEKTRKLLEAENMDIAPLNQEDPQKDSRQNQQNQRNEPRKQRGGLGMG